MVGGGGICLHVMKHLFIFFISLQIEKKIIDLIKHLSLNLQQEGESIKEERERERERRERDRKRKRERGGEGRERSSLS